MPCHSKASNATCAMQKQGNNLHALPPKSLMLVTVSSGRSGVTWMHIGVCGFCCHLILLKADILLQKM
jgi:hypothetical protein